MTIKSVAVGGFELSQGKLLLRGKTLLSEVPENVSLKPLSSSRGAFMGASSTQRKSHNVFSLGILRDLRFMCCFRFKLWWMTQRMGSCGRDLPSETQFLLVESEDSSPDLVTVSAMGGIGRQEEEEKRRMVYTVFLPLLEGSFRASLQGNAEDQLQLCLESGDESIQGNGGTHSLFLHAGEDPFQVIEEAVQAIEMHTKTFRRRENKALPGIIDWFGWCTWDAFYTDVSAEGVRQGIESLKEGGAPPRFVIIDDGWQSVATDEHDGSEGTLVATRLTDIKENFKFQQNVKEGERPEDLPLGLQHVVQELKERHQVKYVYVWHAITGYWGGIKPGAEEMEHYEISMQYPIVTQGVINNDPAMSSDNLTINGLGLAHPDKVFKFYDELHSYLAKAGVDGVKVDVQNIVETLGTGYGGRVSLTHHYQQALEESIARNFPDNGCIACMSHNTDGLYSIKQTSIVRASDDFYPQDPASHSIHIPSVAYNSLFLGEFMQPDWDMFHSLHPCGEFHAAARAVGGCPIYVSDKPGNHDFSLLKKLVLPDGSILRCELPGRPTRDCLFDDPTRDGKSLLKIWNLNKHTGVIGVFNCQGAGWCKVEKKIAVHDAEPAAISGSVNAGDVNYLGRVATKDWTGDCAFYSHKRGDLLSLGKSSALPILLNVLEYEIFTVSPIKRLAGCGAHFAPIGLLHMFNSGGAIRELHYHEDDQQLEQHVSEEALCNNTSSSSSWVEMKIHGCGEFGAYTSIQPKHCFLNKHKLQFSYDPLSGLLKVLIPQSEGFSQDLIFTF